MRLLDKLEKKELDKDGMSPADVYKCVLDNQIVYLKEIDKKFANTTYSVKREAEMMKWLEGKLNVPKVLEYGEHDDKEYLIMSELKGTHIDTFMGEPLKYITYLTNAVKQLQAVQIQGCDFPSNIDYRLNELKYLMENGLADIDLEHWEQSNDFESPETLYEWLCSNKPKEEFVFSHGDIGANFMIDADKIFFYDLARTGVADKWMDIAFCVRKIRHHCQNPKYYERKFFQIMGMEPDYKKIEYFILLDEMF